MDDQFFWKRKLWIYSLLVAAVFLLMGSMNSPFYPFNLWNDADCFLTVGRSLVRGKVLYRDIFEQKGLYLYGLYGLGSLVPGRDFLGVFFVEVAAVTVFLAYAGKALHYFLSQRAVYASLPVLCFLLVTSSSFQKGGSVEELSLPFFMIFLCHAFEYFSKKGGGCTAGKVFADGVCFAVVFWMKYNLCFLFIGGYLFYAAAFLLRKQWRGFIFFMVMTVLGCVLGSVPAILYFSLNGAWGDLWDSYFLTNLSVYRQSLPFWNKGLLVIKNLTTVIKDNLLVFILAVAGTVMFRKKVKGPGVVQAFLLAVFLGFVLGSLVIPDQVYVYYPLPLIVFAAFGFWWLGSYLERFLYSMSGRGVRVLLAFGLCVFTLYNVNGLFLLGTPKEDIFPYKFAEIIHQKENATFLNYGCLDAGVYIAADIEPCSRFFCQLNLPGYTEMTDEQNSMIQEKKVDFFLTRSLFSCNRENALDPAVYEGYQLLAWCEQELQYGQPYQFYLYGKEESSLPGDESS